MAVEKLQLVRIVGPDFAGFETDGTCAAPIIKALVGMTDAEAREHIKAKGWRASVVPDQPSIVHHFADFGGGNAGSFEARGNISITMTTPGGARSPIS
jgi:hypothetical protein